ncbi:MAG TPA: M50 family metallopeptidase, partial [Patescibacteria group bacterium]|nr:M50 family metallopeptidase [Patescibacteria group bacterium]
MSAFLFVLAIILFISLVVVHEFGHFIVARRNGVEVEEFGIFFPPRLYKRKMKGGWIFSINAIPLGGFVKLKGEHDSDTDKGSFGAASLWVKSKIMAAGVFMNLITALVMLTIIGFIGIPNLIPNQYKIAGDTKTSSKKVLITDVEPGSPAAKAGLKAQDQIISIKPSDGQSIPITSADKLPQITKSLAGKNVVIDYVRNNFHFSGNTTLLSNNVVQSSQQKYNQAINSTKLDCTSVALPKGYLGISKIQYELQKSSWSSPIMALGLSTQVSILTFQGLGHAIGGLGSLIAGALTGNSTARSNGQCNASSQVAGPLGIFFILKDGSHLGINFTLFIIAIISLTLALMNILPIPALDGGRLWITLIAHARS